MDDGPAKSTPWVSIKDVAEKYSVAPATVRNWVVVGTKDSAGVLHRLRAVRIGGKYRVKPKWVRDFMTAMQGGQPEPPKVETESKRKKRFRQEKEAVEKRLGG